MHPHPAPIYQTVATDNNCIVPTDDPRRTKLAARSQSRLPQPSRLSTSIFLPNSALSPVPPHEIQRHAEIPQPRNPKPQTHPRSQATRRLRTHRRGRLELTTGPVVVGGRGGVTAVELEGAADGGLLVVRVACGRAPGGHPELPEARRPRAARSPVRP